jgi:hypothetical protein
MADPPLSQIKAPPLAPNDEMSQLLDFRFRAPAAPPREWQEEHDESP